MFIKNIYFKVGFCAAIMSSADDSNSNCKCKRFDYPHPLYEKNTEVFIYTRCVDDGRGHL